MIYVVNPYHVMNYVSILQAHMEVLGYILLAAFVSHKNLLGFLFMFLSWIYHTMDDPTITH